MSLSPGVSVELNLRWDPWSVQLGDEHPGVRLLVISRAAGEGREAVVGQGARRSVVVRESADVLVARAHGDQGAGGRGDAGG